MAADRLARCGWCSFCCSWYVRVEFQCSVFTTLGRLRAIQVLGLLWTGYVPCMVVIFVLLFVIRLVP